MSNDDIIQHETGSSKDLDHCNNINFINGTSCSYCIDPNDGIDAEDNSFFQNDTITPKLTKSVTTGSLISAANHNHHHYHSPELWESRRPSFLGFGIKSSKENEKWLNYLEKSSRMETVQELRHLNLIGNIGPVFEWDNSFRNDSELKSIKNKDLMIFYEKQNELILKYKEVDKLLDSGLQSNMIRNYSDRTDENEAIENYGSTENESLRKKSAVPGNIDLETGVLLGYNKADEISIVNYAIMVNFFANIILLFGKIIVVILTSSISIIASVLDSVLDFLSNVIIFISNKLANTKNPKKFPIGRARLEPIGVLVFSIIIIISFLQIGIESIQRLIFDRNLNKEIVSIDFISFIIMSFTILVKLACYFWCKTINSSSIQALTQDALVDVVFNSFSIIMPVLGHRFQLYWCDPLGALLLSIYIIVSWSYTCFEHILHLTGKSADTEDYKIILYLCSRFAERIKFIKEINCYHVGDSINVEIDLILDSNLSIRDSHDLAEALQYTLEALPNVNIERAFVHIDYTVKNYKGHLS